MQITTGLSQQHSTCLHAVEVSEVTTKVKCQLRIVPKALSTTASPRQKLVKGGQPETPRVYLQCSRAHESPESLHLINPLDAMVSP